MRAVFQFPASITAVVGRAARGEFRGEPHAATVGGHAARDAGGDGGEALADLRAGERHAARGRRRARGPDRGAVGAQGPHGAGGPVF